MTRVTVAQIVAALASGKSEVEILATHDGLTHEDIAAAKVVSIAGHDAGCPALSRWASAAASGQGDCTCVPRR